MSDRPEKIYCGNAKEIEGKYGKQLKLALGPKDFETMMAHKNERGYINIWLHRRKEVGKFGETHYGVIDTWQPDPQTGPGADVGRSRGPEFPRKGEQSNPVGGDDAPPF